MSEVIVQKQVVRVLRTENTARTLTVQEGPPGPTGPQGDPGQGVPVGGTAGQFLIKNSGTDYDTAWDTLDASQIPTLTLAKISDAGTMAAQNASAVAITGGTINGTTIGATTPAAGTFTAVTVQSGSDPSASFRPSGASTNNFLRIYNNVGNERARFSYDTDTAVLSIAVGATLTTALVTLSAGTSSMGLGGVTTFGGSPNKLIVNPYVTADTVANVMINAANTIHKPLVIQGASSQSANLTEWQNSAGSALDFIAASGAATFGRLDSGTNDTQTALTIRRNSSGTPAANFASQIDYQLESSTTENTQAAGLVTSWVVETHLSRTARQVFNIYDTAAREALRLEASGTAPMIGFLGAAAIARYATTGTTAGFTAGAGTAVDSAATFTGNLGATAYTIGDIVNALKQYGLLTQ